LRNDVLRRQAESGYAQSVIMVGSDLTGLLKLQAQEREAAIAILNPARLHDRVKIDNDAIEREYNQNAAHYRTAERVRIEYIRLAVEDLARTVRVSDEELRQAIAEAEQAGAAQEERRASHILVKLAPGSDAATE
jgi:peptidyl-prolyl cis-trans isomerase D